MCYESTFTWEYQTKGVFENSERVITFETQRPRVIYRGSEPQDTAGQYKYFTMDGHEWGSMRDQS